MKTKSFFVTVPTAAIILSFAVLSAPTAQAVGLNGSALLNTNAVSVNASSSASATGTAHSSSSGLRIDASVRSGGAAAEVTKEPGSPAVVDLGIYAKGVSASNSSVAEVDTSSDNSVSVEYARPAKLFGFISIHLPETAVVKVNADGTTVAKVHKAWWSFLASSDTHSDEFSTALQSRIDSDAFVNASAGVKGELTASQKIQYIADIVAAAKAAYSASASVNTGASAY